MKLGFIGMGNMAQAMAEGFMKSGLIDGKNILAYAPHQDKLKINAKRIGFVPLASLKEMTENSDVVIVACKPYQIEDVLKEIKAELKGKALLSIAAGWSFDDYCEVLGEEVGVQCIMPNTPSMVGEGVLIFEEANSLNDDERTEIMNLFKALGEVIELPSNLMGIGMAISGCGPAFMDMIMEAYGDAAVKYGIDRKTAYRLVAQTMIGSAKLQLETGRHPGELKDAVCSPGGTTIRGVDALEHAGLRAACIDSVDAVMGIGKK